MPAAGVLTTLLPCCMQPSSQWRSTRSTADRMAAAGSLAAASDGSGGSSAAPDLQAALMFATPDHGLMLQGQQSLEGQGLMGVLGSAAPQLLLHCRQLVSSPGAPPFTSHVTKTAMQGYVGLGVGCWLLQPGLLDARLAGAGAAPWCALAVRQWQ